MSERLTPAQLARIETDCDVAKQYYARHGVLPTSTGLDVLDRVPAMLAELRRRRAADLSAEDVEALKWALSSMRDDRDKVRAARESEPRWEEKWERADAVLTKLLKGGVSNG